MQCVRVEDNGDKSSTVSYGCEVRAPACSLALVPQLKDMQDIQLSFFRNLCQLRRSVTPHISFREFAERPWLDSWWSMVLGFMCRLSLLPEGSAVSRSGKISMCHPGLPLPRGQSFAHITIGLAGLVICDLSPTMSCQWASVSSGLWCSSDLDPILCPLSRAVLPGQPPTPPSLVHRL